MGKYTRELIEYSGIDKCSFEDLVNFKEISLDNNFCIPDNKPEIKSLIKVKGKAKIDNYKIIQTPNLRILLNGTVTLDYQYASNTENEAVHFETTDISFTDFIALPSDFNVQDMIFPMVSIKYIHCTLIDLKCMLNSLILMLAIETC